MQEKSDALDDQGWLAYGQLTACSCPAGQGAKADDAREGYHADHAGEPGLAGPCTPIIKRLHDRGKLLPFNLFPQEVLIPAILHAPLQLRAHCLQSAETDRWREQPYKNICIQSIPQMMPCWAYFLSWLFLESLMFWQAVCCVVAAMFSALES